ncbi:MAG: hypothetical protein WCJ69_13140 [Betaproteobacteria bacterium]
MAGPHMARVRVLPKQPHDQFLNLMHVADAILDPVCFNGMNNSLDAFSVGTPVVTLPHLFQRGRHTSGMYRRMGWMECVAQSADDYVRRAVSLGNDADLRQHARDEIAARAPVLFEEDQVVREFERFFIDAAQGRAQDQRARGDTPPA